MENFSGPVDEAERRRMGNQLFDQRYREMQQAQINNEGLEQLQRLKKLEQQMIGVDAGVLEVEQHIIDRMKTEVGSSNMKAWAESLEIVRKLERRNA